MAGRDHAALVWGQAGGAVSLEAGAWLSGNVDPSRWPPHLQQYKDQCLALDLVRPNICEDRWEVCLRPYGDKRTELVFISRNLNKEELRGRLEAALVTEEEYELGPEGWATFVD